MLVERLEFASRRPLAATPQSGVGRVVQGRDHVVQRVPAGMVDQPEARPHRFPQVAPPALVRLGGLEPAAEMRLHPLQPQGEHHQHGQHPAEMPLAVTVVVLEVRALMVLERLEHAVLDAPAPARQPRQLEQIRRRHIAVGDPGPCMRLALGVGLHELDDVDAAVVRLGELETLPAAHLPAFDPGRRLRPFQPRLLVGRHLRVQMLMATGLGDQQERHA